MRLDTGGKQCTIIRSHEWRKVGAGLAWSEFIFGYGCGARLQRRCESGHVHLGWFNQQLELTALDARASKFSGGRARHGC